METRKPVRWGRRILLIVVLALLIVLVQIFQSVGNTITRKSDKRIR